MKNIVISFLLTGSCAVSAMQNGVPSSVPATITTPPTSPVTGKFRKSDALAIATSRKANQNKVNEDDEAYFLQLPLPHLHFSNKDRANSPSSSSSPSSSPQQSFPLSWVNSANWYDGKSLDK